MSDAPRLLQLVALPPYERAAKGPLSEGDERWIAATLAQDPHAGDTVRGTGGMRKLRVAVREGEGKSGGARVVYFYRSAKGRVYLVTAYAKHRKESITDDERNKLRKPAATLEAEP
jgi:hypothetical protein